MRLVLFALAMLASPSVAAPDSILWRGQGVVVTLYKKPCVNEDVLSHIHPSNHPLFQAGKADFEGRATIIGCWAIGPSPEGEQVVWFVDELGTAGTLSRENFVR